MEARNLSRYPPGMVNPDRPRPYADIAERLRLIREIAGTDQKTFAADAGLGYSQYKNWETGSDRVGLDGALALRARYGLSLDYIYCGEVEALPFSLRQEVIQRRRKAS